jgi:predicted transcriptional regulator
MENSIEQYSNNGWQNIGICSIFAEENIQYSKIPLYMHIVRRSFGYCEKITNRMSQSEMAKKLKIDKKTLSAHMKYLVENEFVKIIESRNYIDNGGSEAFAYAPKYPSGYGHIKFKENSRQEPDDTQSRVPEIVEQAKAPYADMDF